MTRSIPFTAAAALLALTVAGAGGRAGAQTIPGAVLAKHEPHHHPTYEDRALRVLRVRVAAHDTTLLHEHGPDYFWIALGPSEVVNARLGAPDATIKSSDLSVHYTPGNFAHVARNPGDTPFDNITVELLQPQTHPRNLCEAAIGGAPLSCDHRDAMFVAADDRPAFTTDQLRVSLVMIAPGASLRPVGSAPRRSWIIALDTADARSTLTATRGRWVGGVLDASAKGWTVRNRGTSPVRVLAVTELGGR